ncbi:iron complex transport system substrate-binding protein [Sulfitobacter undariae]|uniref:Iron complex transport system substrate-binding protein n=1 Tax=Sulfitobacter undariae TaxID=1563671 RepID=A0A7W6H1V6_9RHOB|nr:ABC transporter substrate-binding protein [Sulfitobacter undariae]MBB3995148.1 iron complex transport system substrate-binding protein [Sulfitobacter undariae]
MMRSSLSAATQLRLALSAACVGIAALCAGPVSAQSSDATRILSIGGSVTEIVYALNQQHRLIARDTTSVFPEAAIKLPDVGYIRALSAEGVLSVAPELILSEEGAGPPETVAALQAASIPFVTIPEAYTAQGVVAKVLAVGEALGQQQAAQALGDQINQQFAQAADKLNGVTERKKVLFVLSTQGGRVLASGTHTAADGIITMAGGINAITAFEGYKPLTDEAILAAAPDVILMMDRTGDHAIDDEAIRAMPAFMPTAAAQTGAIIRMDGAYLLGFGPRTAQAALDLHAALYGG